MLKSFFAISAIIAAGVLAAMTTLMLNGTIQWGNCNQFFGLVFVALITNLTAYRLFSR